MKKKQEKVAFIRVKEAATALSVSERFLRQLVRRGQIPFYKLSPRTLRFDLQELRDYMKLLAEGHQEKRAGK